jgi:hypothetical protein
MTIVLMALDVMTLLELATIPDSSFQELQGWYESVVVNRMTVEEEI